MRVFRLVRLGLGVALPMSGLAIAPVAQASGLPIICLSWLAAQRPGALQDATGDNLDLQIMDGEFDRTYRAARALDQLARSGASARPMRIVSWRASSSRSRRLTRCGRNRPRGYWKIEQGRLTK
jgi:hypothetical protein